MRFGSRFLHSTLYKTVWQHKLSPVVIENSPYLTGKIQEPRGSAKGRVRETRKRGAKQAA